MVVPALLDALRTLSQRTKNRGIRWVLVGSTSLALQGVDMVPSDIDVLTDKEGALKLGCLLKDCEVRPVQLRRSEMFESYFGEFRVNEVKVEVMGDLRERQGDQWVSLAHRLKSPKLLRLEEITVPVSPLEEQLASYRKLGRPKDAARIEKIEQALKKQKLALRARNALSE